MHFSFLLNFYLNFFTKIFILLIKPYNKIIIFNFNVLKMFIKKIKNKFCKTFLIKINIVNFIKIKCIKVFDKNVK